MSRDLHWSLVVTRSPVLDGEGKITIERTSIQRLVKQAFDAGAESAAAQRIKKDTPKESSTTINELRRMFAME